MKLVMAVAQGPACEGQGGASVVRRAINYACLAKGFSAASPEDATVQHGPYLYKLQSVPVSLVAEHVRGIMDSFGYKGVDMNEVLGYEDYRSAYASFLARCANASLTCSMLKTCCLHLNILLPG